MKTAKAFALTVLVLLFAVVHETARGQVNLQRVGSINYAQFDGIWYTVVDSQQGDLVDTKHLVVRLKDKSDINRFDFTAIDLPHLRSVRGELVDGFYVLEIPDELNSFEIARKLEATGRFNDVVFNLFIKVHANPNDPHYGSQWNLPKISMASAWDITTGSNTVIVAVIDVGGDHGHEDLIGNRWSGIGYDFYDEDSDPYPSDGARHGTAVAGILAALTNNSIGVAGVAGGWSGVGGIRIMHLDAGFRKFNPYIQEWEDLMSTVSVSQSIGFAASNGARVINMSFGQLTPSSILESAINNAHNNYDVVFVASSGNYKQGDPTTVYYPAAYSNVIAVGATIPNDNRKELNDGTESWWGSCYGSQLDVMAPGVYIWTTDLTGSIGYSSGNYYGSFNGTSSAAPHVAGLAALIYSTNPSLTWQQVRETIRLSADKVSGMGGQNFTNQYGYGRINANKAVRNLYVPQAYSTIASALSAAKSGQTVVVASGSHTVSANLTVASGRTLQINPGATLNFTGNYKLRVEGKLTANGTSSNKITFTRSGGTWYGIEFYNASASSQIFYSIIQNAQYGVRVINSSPALAWNTIRYNTVGVQFNNSSFSYGGTLQGNIIEDNFDGVKCYQYSDPAITPSNVIRYNIYNGVYGDATSVPSLGYYYGTGYNSLYWNGTEVWSNYSGTINARYNWWGESNPTPNVSNNVDWSNYLNYDPNSGMGMVLAKAGASESQSNEFASEAVADTVGIAEVNRAHEALLKGEYARALALFEGIVGTYPDHVSGRRALAFVGGCLQKLNRANEAVARRDQLVRNYAGKEIFGLNHSLAVGDLVKN